MPPVVKTAHKAVVYILAEVIFDHIAEVIFDLVKNAVLATKKTDEIIIKQGDRGDW